DSKTGEVWGGPQPTLQELHRRRSIPKHDLSELEYLLTLDAGVVKLRGTRIWLVRETEQSLNPLVDTWCSNNGVDLEHSDAMDGELAEFLSEMRLNKDEFEIAELRGSVESTIRGFEDIVRAIPQAIQHARGERVIETAFFARARLEG